MNMTKMKMIARCLAIAGAILPIVAEASQGPGGGPGTATAFTQLAMAIAVYGGIGLIVAAGLIGALRQAL